MTLEQHYDEESHELRVFFVLRVVVRSSQMQGIFHSQTAQQ